MHITELKDKGVRHIERNEPDSAMACFLIVMSRYSDNMSVRDKQTCTKAFNNAGYVHTLMYSDYTTAYRYLLKALDIAKSIDFSQQYPLIYINIGNIYIFFEDFNNAASFYIKAYQTAKDVGDIPHMNHAINNLLLTMRAALSKEELLNIINSYFNSDLSNDSTSTFTRELCLITKDFLEGNTSVSDQLKRIDRLINNSTIDERNMENLKFLNMRCCLKMANIERY